MQAPSKATLADLEITAGPTHTDRALLIGTVRYGKSTLAATLVRMFSTRYSRPSDRTRTSCRVLVIDTKPRWRATRTVTGRSVRARYKYFVKGDVLDGVVLDDMRDWNLAWSPDLNPSGIVIAQRLDLESGSAGQIAFMLQTIRRFFDTQIPSVPSLLFVDEGMDFFGESGSSIQGTAIARCWRVGGEKGMSCLMGLQRPKQVSLQLLTESNILYLFHLRYEADTKRLYEMGFPPGVDSPRQRYRFLLFRDDELYPNELTLRLAS